MNKTEVTQNPYGFTSNRTQISDFDDNEIDLDRANIN